jgi:hypothetical protein
VVLAMVRLDAETADAGREADHHALRALLGAVTESLNTDDLGKLQSHLATSFVITFADQKRFTEAAAIQAYRDNLRRERHLERATFAPVADALTTFLDADCGVCTGTSSDSFSFAGGTTVTLISRWTATVVRQNGEWKIAALHAGVDLLDNPLLAGARDFATKLAIGAALIAGILGLIIGVILGRRRARST